jgi:hypothetical protein
MAKTKTTRKAKTPKGASKKHPRVLKGTVVPVAYKAAYAEHNDTCGDRVALALKDATTKVVENRSVLDVDALRKIAKDNGIDFAPYEHLNNGQKRMNVGNKLRGLVRDGEPVKIAGKTFEGAAAIKAKAHVEQASA